MVGDPPGAPNHPPGVISGPNSHTTHPCSGIYKWSTNITGLGSPQEDVQTLGVIVWKCWQSLHVCIIIWVNTIASGCAHFSPFYSSFINSSIFYFFTFCFFHISLVPWLVPLVVGSFESSCSSLSFDTCIIFFSPPDHHLFQFFVFIFPTFLPLVICCLPSNHHYHPSSIIHHHPQACPLTLLFPSSVLPIPGSLSSSPSSSPIVHVKISGVTWLGGSLGCGFPMGYLGVVEERIYPHPSLASPTIILLDLHTDHHYPSESLSFDFCMCHWPLSSSPLFLHYLLFKLSI